MPGRDDLTAMQVGFRGNWIVPGEGCVNLGPERAGGFMRLKAFAASTHRCSESSLCWSASAGTPVPSIQKGIVTFRT